MLALSTMPIKDQSSIGDKQKRVVRFAQQTEKSTQDNHALESSYDELSETCPSKDPSRDIYKKHWQKNDKSSHMLYPQSGTPAILKPAPEVEDWKRYHPRAQEP